MLNPRSLVLPLFILFVLFSDRSNGQNLYDQYKTDLNNPQRREHSELIKILTYQQPDGKARQLDNTFVFNSDGSPSRLQFFNDTAEVKRIDFRYTNNRLDSIEEFHYASKYLIAEIRYGQNDSVSQVLESVFSSYDNEKLLSHAYQYFYYPQGSIKQVLMLEGSKPDTIEILNYDQRGNQITSFTNNSGLTTRRTEFIWNKDSSVCREVNYNRENKPYNIVESIFQNGRIIKRTDPGTSPNPSYWKYDSLNRVIETNSAVFFVQNITYDQEGRMSKRLMTETSEYAEGRTPRKIEVSYEYIQRKR